jgi:hypothetical protein
MLPHKRNAERTLSCLPIYLSIYLSFSVGMFNSSHISRTSEPLPGGNVDGFKRILAPIEDNTEKVEVFAETKIASIFACPRYATDMKNEKKMWPVLLRTVLLILVKNMQNILIPGPGEHDNYTCNCVPHDMKIIYQVKKQ